MTKEEFVRNNRGINESEDLPSQYLSQARELFDYIPVNFMLFFMLYILPSDLRGNRLRGDQNEANFNSGNFWIFFLRRKISSMMKPLKFVWQAWFSSSKAVIFSITGWKERFCDRC